MISLRYLLQLCDIDFMLLLFFLKSLLLWSPKCKCFSLATWILDGHANTVTFLQRVSSDFGPLSPHVLSTQHLCLRSSPLVLSLLSQSLRSGFYSATPCSIPLPFPPPFSLLQVLPHLPHAGLNSQHGIHCHWLSLLYVSVYFLSCFKAWNVRMRQGQHSLSLQKRPRSSKTIQRLVCARHAERTLKSQTWKVWPWPLGNLLSNEAEKVSTKLTPLSQCGLILIFIECVSEPECIGSSSWMTHGEPHGRGDRLVRQRKGEGFCTAKKECAKGSWLKGMVCWDWCSGQWGLERALRMVGLASSQRESWCR